MIEVLILQANETMVKDKNTFLENELYFGRWSNTHNSFVVKSEEGNWIIIWTHSRFTYGYSMSEVLRGFKSKATIYMKNRKRINKFSNPEEYLNGNNCKQEWAYGAYYDKELRWR